MDARTVNDVAGIRNGRCVYQEYASAVCLGLATMQGDIHATCIYNYLQFTDLGE